MKYQNVSRYIYSDSLRIQVQGISYIENMFFLNRVSTK